MTKEPDPKRYQVEYLDWEAGKKLAAERGMNAEDDGLWEAVDQGEITVLKPFWSRQSAITWARKHRKLDVFNMPRVREETLTVHDTDDLGRRVQPVLHWDLTGYWEVDGGDVVEIDVAA